MPTGTTYTGGFSDNLRSGTGKQVYADGTVYEGDFSNDMKNGTGTITYANGDTYTGDFVNDKRSGSGTYTWSNGESYTGEFNDDQLSGTGTYKWPSGRTYTGKFSNGTIVLDEALIETRALGKAAGESAHRVRRFPFRGKAGRQPFCRAARRVRTKRSTNIGNKTLAKREHPSGMERAARTERLKRS